VLGLGVVLVAIGCGGGPQPATTRGGQGSTEDEPRVVIPSGPLSEEEAEQAQTQALQSFMEARTYWTRCTEREDEIGCRRARHLFRVAADTWNALVAGRPQDAGVDEWTFMHAQALWRAGSPAAAADVAARYVESGTNAEWRTTAAALMVAARARVLEEDEAVTIREAPPEPRGEPVAVQPIELPEALARLYEARAKYVEAVPEAADPEHVRRAYRIENAVIDYRYGRWEQARTALREIFESGCSGGGAWEGAAAAWRILREMAITLGHYDAVSALGRELGERSCTFGIAEAPTCGGGDSEDPRCLAETDAVSGQLRTGTSFLQRARHARAGDRSTLGTRAGMAFLAVLEDEATLPPLARVAALTQAGAAFRLAGNAELAADVDRRIVDEVVPAGFDEADRARVIAVVAGALVRLLDEARRSTRHEDVVRVSALLLTEEFDLPELAERRAIGRAMRPLALAALGRHRDASDAWTALAAAETDPVARRDATLASALALAEAGDCRRATTALRAFTRTYRGQEGAGDAVVRALHRYAMCQREGSRARETALDEVAAAAEEAPESLGAESKGYAAAATFANVDRDFALLAQLRVQIPRVENTEALPEALREALADPAAQVRDLVDGYDRVVAFEDVRWSAAAHLRAGLALERLVAVILEASWSVPQDLESQRRGLHAQAFAQLRGIVETRVREVLETQARPIRCRAAERFHRSVGVAHRAGTESEHATSARERLAALGEAVVARCRAASPASFR
jgi:hypothetical protein